MTSFLLTVATLLLTHVVNFVVNTCKAATKCLNVRERVEEVEWNITWSPPFPCCSVGRHSP